MTPLSRRPKGSHVTVTRMKNERGWSDEMIHQYLGAPDREVKNPHGRSKPRMRLYLIERINQAVARHPELSDRIRERKQQVRLLRLALEKQARGDDSDLIAIVELTADADLPRERLCRRETVDYALWRAAAGMERVENDQPTDERLVNWLRHRGSNYETLLSLAPYCPSMTGNRRNCRAIVIHGFKLSQKSRVGIEPPR